MRISPLALLAFVMAFTSAGWKTADARTLTIGTEGTYPPFSEAGPSGHLTGFDVDMAQALCRSMDVTCNVVRLDRTKLRPALLSGRIDAIVSSMWITPERRRQLGFTVPYYNTPPAIAVPKDSEIAGVTNADLAGKRLGTQAATPDAAYAKTHLADAELKLYPSTVAYQTALAGGKLDAVIDDAVILSQWLASDSGTCCKLLATVPVDQKINGIGAGIALRKDETDLRKAFDTALAAIRRNGTYSAIASQFFDFDIDGDHSDR